ncbi:MAG: P-loop NTPase [Chloroflexota bacterium]|nr:P-loop NTPase [Chloroflexota bacterium]
MAKSLSGMRVVVCGKGGSGKSTVVTLMANVLRDKGYSVHVVDGDASNPGLYWMLGFEEAPEPLIDFYGGKFFSGGKVTCPVDDPTPLLRGEIGLDELPGEYFVESEGLTFFRAGKIEGVFEGCDGPESKIVRDFSVPGDHVTLIDLVAGMEHFGRGVEINADGVVAVIDPTSTSLELAKVAKEMMEGMRRGDEPATFHLESPEDVEMARKLAKGAKVKNLWVVLNKIRSRKIESLMRERLEEYGIEPIGSIREDLELLESSLEGASLRESGAKEDVEKIVSLMENP